MVLMAQAECLYAGVVAAVQAIVNHHTYSEAGSESVAEKILVYFCASEFSKFGVDFGKHATYGLTVGKEVTVIVQIHGNTEFFLKEGPESHTVAERGKIGEVSADDSVGIVSRAGESKADCHWLLVEFGYHLFKSFHHGLETKVKVVGVGGHCYRVDNEIVALHCAEHKVCTSRIESDYNSFVKFIHINVRFKFSFICILCRTR